MELSREQLQAYVANPNIIQRDILTFLEDATEENLAITNPTNPFTMLMEASVVTPFNSFLETSKLLRKKYPDLATTREELYHHLTDEELPNMFAVPAEVDIVFYVNIMNLKYYGHRPDGAKYVETIIPINTEINILNIPFTLLNDIIVRLYDEGNIYVEQINNDEDIAVNDLGILNSEVITDSEGIGWIIFETNVKQVKKTTVTDTIINSEGFSKKVALNGQYFYSNVFYKNSSTNNEYVKLLKKHSEDYLDPFNPYAYIKLLDKEIEVNIPDMYIMDNSVSGNVKIDVYTTQGKLYLPINNFKTSDFKIVLGDTKKSISAATSTNIGILANSRSIIDGGVNTISVDELKSSIINHTTGDIDLPITIYDLKRKSGFYGFEIFKALDIVTDRIFIANKALPTFNSKLLSAKIDVYFNTLELVTSDYLDQSMINITNDVIVIKSNTVFIEQGGKVTILKDSDLDSLRRMSHIDLIQYTKITSLYFTPYYYIIDKIDNTISTRVYDLDRPKMSNLKIVGKNNSVKQKTNTSKFTIMKTDNGYKILLLLVLNKELEQINKANLKGRMKISLLGNDTFVYLDSVYNPATGYLEFYIDSDLFIDEDGYINITNGVSTIANKKINLNSTATIYLYTTDMSVKDDTNYLIDEINLTDENVVVLTKELIDIELGKELKYLWNKVYNTYNERKYKRYEQNIPLVYEEDVYEKDPETGNTYKCIEDEDGNKQLIRRLEHAKGDPVLDADGNPVYKYKKGDVILDENGLPIIDLDNGLVRYIDILMFEYEFSLANTTTFKNYLISVLDVIDNWMFNDIAKLNENILENSVILYKSYKVNKPITVTINNINYSMPYKVQPYVILYTTRKKYDSDEIATIKNKIGDIIYNELNNSEIVLKAIKDKIKLALGEEIVGIKIENLDNIGNAEAFRINDPTSRLTLDKKLELNKNNDLIVEYNITLDIQTI